jgi:hypothetical protein
VAAICVGRGNAQEESAGLSNQGDEEVLVGVMSGRRGTEGDQRD